MTYSALGPIAIHLPPRVETNDDLRAQFPEWNIDLICEKTGIRERHIAEPDECASDLGVKAAEKLFADFGIDRQSIDFLLLCTQTPDYPFPTTACLLQHRLGLKTSAGALDFNLGCSGYVYGLALADGLIRSGAARRVLLLTAETYSKWIHPADRALRPIFGDGAAATLIEAADRPTIGSFVFGTDGSGADLLLVNTGGARKPEHAIKPSKRSRWPSPMFMDGPALVDFADMAVPVAVDRVLRLGDRRPEDIDFYISHQATHKLLERLRERMKLTEQKMPTFLASCGNTVSSTIPIVIDELRRTGRLRAGMTSLLIGFGVGLSWSGCLWTESWTGGVAKP